MEQEIVIRYEYIFREFLDANDQFSIMHLESLISYHIKLQDLLIWTVLSRNWMNFKINMLKEGVVACVYMCIYICAQFAWIYFLSFTNANTLAENLQTFNNFINHPRLIEASLIYFVCLKNLIYRFNIGSWSNFFTLFTSLSFIHSER